MHILCIGKFVIRAILVDLNGQVVLGLSSSSSLISTSHNRPVTVFGPIRTEKVTLHMYKRIKKFSRSLLSVAAILDPSRSTKLNIA
jgi:hypothetical protein